MNLGKIIDELKGNAAELKSGIEALDFRLDAIEESARKARDANNRLDKNIDLILSYLKRAEEATVLSKTTESRIEELKTKSIKDAELISRLLERVPDLEDLNKALH